MKLFTTVLCTTVLAGAALSAQCRRRPASPAGHRRNRSRRQVGDRRRRPTGASGRSTRAASGSRIAYSRPLKRGRELFGTGDAYATKLNAGAPVWRAGANVSTRLKTEAPLVIGGKTLPPASTCCSSTSSRATGR